jgi:hypothetical protein
MCVCVYECVCVCVLVYVCVYEYVCVYMYTPALDTEEPSSSCAAAPSSTRDSIKLSRSAMLISVEGTLARAGCVSARSAVQRSSRGEGADMVVERIRGAIMTYIVMRTGIGMESGCRKCNRTTCVIDNRPATHKLTS